MKDCIPTLLGYLSIGFAAGVVGAAEGLSVLEIGLMSVFLYAGSAQFIVAGMMSAGSRSYPSSSPCSSSICAIFCSARRWLRCSGSIQRRRISSSAPS